MPGEDNARMTPNAILNRFEPGLRPGVKLIYRLGLF
jgi:hypothetical protein